MAPPTLIFGLLALLLVSSALGSSVDAPFILAHKKASLTRLKSGAERVSVSIDIYNQGSSTAYDVSLTDGSWPENVFDVVSGNTSMSWERLDAGGLLTHSFELEAKAKGLFYSAPAVITFRIPTKAALQEAYSTPILPLDVLADRPTEKKFEWAKHYAMSFSTDSAGVIAVKIAGDQPKLSPWKRTCTWLQRLLAKYGSLVSVISIMVLFVYLISTPSKSSAAKGSKKKR